MAIRVRLVWAVIGLMLIGEQGRTQASPPGQGQLPLSKIEAFFAKLKAEGVDVDGALPWCYFFFSYDRAKLDDAAKILTPQGYTVVDVQSQPNALPDGPVVWRLQMRRAEHLTPEGVFARDAALDALADKVGSLYYDGLDIAPAK